MGQGEFSLVSIVTWIGRVAALWLLLRYADPWITALIGKL